MALILGLATAQDSRPSMLRHAASTPTSSRGCEQQTSAPGYSRSTKTYDEFTALTHAPPAASQARVAEEARREGDVVFVGGREGLPHVGKAAEKSAAWWRTAPKRSSARFFCKTDDDSLIHHGHLRAALEAAEASAIDGQGRPTKNIVFSYIRWRGWLPNHRLQACGGG